MSAALRVTGGQIPEKLRGPSSAPRRAPIARHFAAAALALAAVLSLVGCDYFGFTPVKDIVAAPAQFEGKEVKIKGTVGSPVQLLNLRTFAVKDETGEIMVTTNGSLPPAGAQVAVKGTVKSVVIVGGKSAGLRVEETQRLR
jgi:hypothetical protein